MLFVRRYKSFSFTWPVLVAKMICLSKQRPYQNKCATYIGSLAAR